VRRSGHPAAATFRADELADGATLPAMTALRGQSALVADTSVIAVVLTVVEAELKRSVVV
jgi:hypothetical protein